MLVKQGQTIYRVYFDFSCLVTVMEKMFLYSHKIEQPKMGQIVNKYPVNYVRDMIAKHGSKGIYQSRRKALKAFNLLKAEQSEIWDNY